MLCTSGLLFIQMHNTRSLKQDADASLDVGLTWGEDIFCWKLLGSWHGSPIALLLDSLALGLLPLLSWGTHW